MSLSYNVYVFSQIGHFENAFRPNVMTFRETIPWVHNFIQHHQPKTMYMYCTGGIRCTRLSAYIYSQSLSFTDMPQLYVVRNENYFFFYFSNLLHS